MQTPSAKRFHLERKGSSPGTPHRYWSRPLSLKKSVKDTAREVVGMILTCFNPQQSKAGKGDDGEADLYQVKEISCMSLNTLSAEISSSITCYEIISSIRMGLLSTFYRSVLLSQEERGKKKKTKMALGRLF